MLKRLDWKLNIAVFFLMFAGLVSLISAKPELFWRQLVWIVIGLFLAVFFVFFDWRSFTNFKGVIWGIYGLAIFLLALTLIVAPRVRGTKSWIPIGPFQFQTSVFAALALIIILANFFRKKHKSIANPISVIQSFAYFLIPAGLILFQPDMGSALLLFLIWFGFILVSGIPWKRLAVVLVIFLILGGVMWGTVLKDYQKERVTGLFFPDKDVLGINYNVIQSKIAIGSGGIFGKGFQQGSQTQLGFLPEAQTDFMFAAVVEEWGLVAGFLLIASFGFIIFRVVNIGVDEPNNFNKFICLGAAVYFLANFIFNTGSNIGFLPVVGVPYPFLSYGGSHLLVELILVGMVQSIRIRK